MLENLFVSSGSAFGGLINGIVWCLLILCAVKCCAAVCRPRWREH